MSHEYAKFSSLEIKSGKKSALKSQLELLTALKHLMLYKKLRTEEFFLKIKFKNSIEHINESLNELDRILPKTKMKQSKESKEYGKEEKIISIKHEPSSLEQELDEIRRKLAALGK